MIGEHLNEPRGAGAGLEEKDKRRRCGRCSDIGLSGSGFSLDVGTDEVERYAQPGEAGGAEEPESSTVEPNGARERVLVPDPVESVAARCDWPHLARTAGSFVAVA